MRGAYFDSSILMSMMLLEERAATALEPWVGHPRRVSSILLKAECWTVLRSRFLRNRIQPSPAWMRERTDFLAEALATVQILHVDDRVMEVLREKVEPAECRTLDSLHLATALFLSDKGGEGLVVISLDEKMRQAARKLGLDVLSA